MLQRLQDSAFSQWVVGSDSLLAYPTILTLHTAGLALVVGASVVVDLRTLGVGGAIPISALRRAFTILWIGFVINLLSGLALFASEAADKGAKPVFYVKLALVIAALAVTSVLRRTTFGAADDSVGPTGAARVLAVASLVLWGGAIVAGRLMAYI